MMRNSLDFQAELLVESLELSDQVIRDFTRRDELLSDYCSKFAYNKI